MMKTMKRILFVLFCSVAVSVQAQNVKKIFKDAEKQTKVLLSETEKIKPSSKDAFSPRTLDSAGTLKLVRSGDWTAGFPPGVLWFLYEYTNNPEWKKQAEIYTQQMEREQWNGSTHDMGFKIFCSVGAAYKMTKNDHYKDVIVQAAKTLATRFNQKNQILRSWNHSNTKWDFPVIIDNMMNLELLFEASKMSNDPSLYKVAVAHANTTMKNHFREDFSSFHVVDYDSINGGIRKKTTAQGYADASAWARGQAWGLYGYTMCYRYTKDPAYLKLAENIASFILNHPNLPKDMIPYWDFNAPNIPNEPKDASAGAIIASALYELSLYSSNGKKYRDIAEDMVESLTEHYRSKIGENRGFLLLHSTGNKPANSEVDVPLNYADYYYLEAVMRHKKLKEKKSLF
jgi:unsaturated chondroitin disaccharide hydrolase